MVQMATTLSAAYPDRKISTRKAPDVLIKIMGKFVPIMKLAAKNLGRTSDVDGSVAERTFGFTYILVDDALLASAEFVAGKEV